MRPQGRARIVNLGPLDFDSISPASLGKLVYSIGPVIGDDEHNQLVVNDVFAVLTNNGYYAKVKVLETGYDIRLQWTTFDLR
jgi:hypothetical protein